MKSRLQVVSKANRP